MKKWVADKLICPQCLDAEIALNLTVREADAEDVLDGEMTCPQCGSIYPIQQGIAVLLPEKTRIILNDHRGYNAPGMLSAYLWSHFGDLLKDPDATQAYQVWSAGFTPTAGDALDVGCAVGRLSFDLAATHDHVIGLDTSIAFIRKAREILTRKEISFDLIVEGHITEPRTHRFNESHDFSRVDFIVADALALPFRTRAFATTAAINLLEKVPDPLKHLTEINRVLRDRSAMFLFSDPFSWDETVSPPERWLSGNGNAQYSARGIDTMRRIFAGEFGVFDPPLGIADDGNVAWKIRKTENLWEHITSQYLVGRRE
ncbi:methyltransferase domain-containing protein [Desulfosarcina ovata]|uniref:SAM-dependent methyltransferase n=1 Tax=Desulfosarcina ovata subsp. ovata TaxID=2752305 RepID=A0A5K8AER9_9BACT|nr:methyltransferase domain-containing protein [Desulfosarcina ovata]BBO90978.1 SAM-dependent methyltransferase [Desulfosarcina ovata subsp. ovata]